MTDGVTVGGKHHASHVDPKQSATYLSVRKILVHRMMPPANAVDDNDKNPSFSTVLSGMNEGLDELCKNMRWRSENLQETRALLPDATRKSVPGPRASPADQLIHRGAEGPGNQYPSRFERQYAAAQAIEPRGNSDGRLAPLKQPENGHQRWGGSHPATRRSNDMAPPSARSAASSVIQHDVWMTSRVSNLLMVPPPTRHPTPLNPKVPPSTKDWCDPTSPISTALGSNPRHAQPRGTTQSGSHRPSMPPSRTPTSRDCDGESIIVEFVFIRQSKRGSCQAPASLRETRKV